MKQEIIPSVNDVENTDSRRRCNAFMITMNSDMRKAASAINMECPNAKE